MGIEIYTVSRDNFKFEEGLNDFDFPCCVCIHRNKNENCDECSKCDHNLNADKE